MKTIAKNLLLLVLAVSACIGCQSGGKKIFIVNLMRQPVLDSVEAQTKQFLLTHGYAEKDGYLVIEKNLNGQKDLLPTLVNEVNNEHPQLVIAITTPVAQAFVKKRVCPIVFSLVTDPVEAGILDSLHQTKPDITGTSDIFPFEQQIKLIRTIHPAAKTIGLIYDPGEAPARYALGQLQRICPKYGFQLISKPATSSGEVPQAAKSLVGKADIFFVSSDNTAIEGVPTLVSICVQHHIPLYVGDTGSVEKGGIATCSVSYGSFGTATGVLADKMLRGQQNLPVYIPSQYEIAVNLKSAELMHVQLPASLLKQAKIIYKDIK